MSDPDRSFWLCHSCGAQMRPIRVDGVQQCASCNSEFIEILDSSVNPDPWHELPASPPTRPHESPPRLPDPTAGMGGLGTMMSGIFSSIFGSGGSNDGAGVYDNDNDNGHPHDRQRDTPATTGSGSGSGSGHSRTYSFNIGNGTGSVTFGSIGGAGAAGASGPSIFGPFPPSGPSGGDQGGGLDAFFPGFPPPAGPNDQGPGRMHQNRHWQNHQDHHNQHWQHPPRTQAQQAEDQYWRHYRAAVALSHREASARRQNRMQGQQLQGQNEFFRALTRMLANEGALPIPSGRMDMGDYVGSEHGFDRVVEMLMQAAGPQGPLPATDAVIEGLPRFKLDAPGIEKSPFKDCPVCKDDFVPDDEVMRVPCKHLFHVDCLQPWLKTNGSCPVCRFSLVPDEANRDTRPDAQQPAPADTPPRAAPEAGAEDGPVGSLTNILQRLWGQAGSPTTSTTANNNTTDSGSGSRDRFNATEEGERPPHAISPLPRRASSRQGQRVYDPPDHPPPASASSQRQADDDLAETFPNAIPDDYRARHRQREREQQGRNPNGDDLD